jgi:hypothetical protein
MTQTVDHERKQEHTREEPSGRPEASQHGRTGEGAASAMAHLISQDERDREENRESPDAS